MLSPCPTSAAGDVLPPSCSTAGTALSPRVPVERRRRFRGDCRCSTATRRRTPLAPAVCAVRPSRAAASRTGPACGAP